FFSKRASAVLIGVAALFSLLVPGVFAQNLEWVKSAGGAKGASTYLGNIFIDKTGHTYATGTFHIKTTFDNKEELVTSTVTEYGDIFIVKYAPDGTMLWAMRDGGTG